jgi:acyl dehydratase
MSDARAPRLYLEDLHVGDRFTSGEHALDAAQIIAFAREFDPQPFHTDPEKAEHTFFRGLAASGWHTAALTMKLLVESGIPLADGIIGSGGEVAWPQPTRPDDVLHVESEVMEIIPSRSKPERGMVVMRCETRNQRGEVLQRFSPKMVVSRRPKA